MSSYFTKLPKTYKILNTETNMDISGLTSENKNTWPLALKKLIDLYTNVYSFPELNEGTKRKDLWKALTNVLKNSSDPETLKNCFIVIRILGREKDSLSFLINDELLDLIKNHAGFKSNFSFGPNTTSVCIETLKSICNLAFNCRDVAERSCKNGILEGVLKRITKHEDLTIDDDVKFFDLKILFILTAVCPESRKVLNKHLNDLIKYLSYILIKATENHLQHEELPPLYLNESQVNKVSELLKVLFNATIALDESDPEVMASCYALTDLLRSYLLIPTCDLEQTWNLRTHVINLLTNMPSETYKDLIMPIQGHLNVPKNLQYDGYNMTAIYEILMFLSAKLNDEIKIGKQHELLSPVVSALLKATSQRVIRKFLKHQILPPLKDVHNRPEQGNTIRNHLCRLLTIPITQLRDLVAELLFVLCKKNVVRMIKYTGYGNAAGLLAQRGLLAGGHDKGESEFTSDSSDSETEEYADLKDQINPVIGCYEPPHPNAMANMTEEQKEYEAMKLIDLMDNLMKTGAIKPCKIGEDGKPKPIEHVMELQEALKNQAINRNSDSD